MTVTDLIAVYAACLAVGGFSGLVRLSGKRGR